MSLFGSLMGDVEDDPFSGFGAHMPIQNHMRHMRHMNNMMNSLFSDPFGMLGGDGPLAIMGPRHGNAMMPFMPQMPNLNRLFGAEMDVTNMHQIPGSSYTSSTVVMSSGPGGKPQVYKSTSSTKIGPHGIKETCKTMQDSRTGTKTMAIGHHIGERAHLIEREQNYYTGDREERQEFINLEEEEAEDFDREYQYKASSATHRGGSGRPAIQAARRDPQRLALPAPPAAVITVPNTSSEGSGRRHSGSQRPSSRRPIRSTASPLTITSSPTVREVYGSAHPQRAHRHKQHKTPAPAHAHGSAPQYSAHAAPLPAPLPAHSYAPAPAHSTHAEPQPAHSTHRHSPVDN